MILTNTPRTATSKSNDNSLELGCLKEAYPKHSGEATPKTPFRQLATFCNVLQLCAPFHQIPEFPFWVRDFILNAIHAIGRLAVSTEQSLPWACLHWASLRWACLHWACLKEYLSILGINIAIRPRARKCSYSFRVRHRQLTRPLSSIQMPPRPAETFQSNAQGVRTKNPKNQNFFYLFLHKHLQILTIRKIHDFSHQMRNPVHK